MRSEIYWIDATTQGRLAVMPRPRGGDWLEDEVNAWRLAGIDVVVSLLTPDEVTDFDLQQEKSTCEAVGINFIPFPIADRSTPASKKSVADLAAQLATQLQGGANIAIHCRQGLGRAPLLAICVLLLVGLRPAAATRAVSAARGCHVPETAEQERWIAEFARELEERAHAAS
jgi:protein-tyrosine phosphatase